MPTPKKETTKALAVRDVELGADGLIPTAVLADALTTKTKLHVVLDNEDIAAAMLARKLGASTVEELGAGAELDDIEGIYGKPVQVHGVGFRNSDDKYDSKLGVYVVLNIVTSAGEILTVGTGSLDVVVTCAKIAELDRLGKDWWIIAPAEKETAAGYTPLNMTLATKDGSGEPF